MFDLISKAFNMKKTTFYFLTTILTVFASTLSSSQTTANYTITVSTTWNAADHGSILDNNLPNDPHWSPLAFVTHKNENEFFSLGDIASQGVQNIAETGGTSSFQSEVNTAIAANTADQYKQAGFSPRGAISSASINNVTVNEAFPLVTFLSMVAPSPDWFIGVNSESLRSGSTSNNGWKATYSLDLFTYDAGTDDGLDYASANAASNPKVGVFMINGAPLNGLKIATVTFTLNSTLSSASFENTSGFHVFPNPVTTGTVSISNLKNSKIETIEIYSKLGQLVKQYLILGKDSNLQLDVSGLNRGIYILRINDELGLSKSQKLIIK